MLITASALGVDPTPGRYTVLIPMQSGGAKYVVYDNLSEAQNSVSNSNFGQVYDSSMSLVHQWAGTSSFTPGNRNPVPVAAPTTPTTVVRPSSFTIVGPASGGGLPALTAGSIRVVSVTKTASGADVKVYLGSNYGGQSTTVGIGALLGSWQSVMTIPGSLSCPTGGWYEAVIHISETELARALQSKGATLRSGLTLALPTTFGSHNTGMPGMTANTGGVPGMTLNPTSEQDALFTFP